MTLVTLGDQPSNEVLPFHKCDVLRGIATAADVVWPNAQTVLSTGSVNMQLQVQPTEPCYWRVDANVCVKNTAAAWASIYLILDLAPVDDGTAQPASVMPVHSTAPYHTMFMSHVWKLNAGTLYTCRLLSGTTNTACRYYRHRDWLSLHGYTYGEDTF